MYRHPVQRGHPHFHCTALLPHARANPTPRIPRPIAEGQWSREAGSYADFCEAPTTASTAAVELARGSRQWVQ